MTTSLCAPHRAHLVAPRRSSPIALVAHGETCIPVPAPALANEDYYPLFGIQHGTVAIPRPETMPELREYLVLEYAQGKPWEVVWSGAVTSRPGLFNRYTLVLLPRASRDLPAADLVFKVTPRFGQIPQQHMALLSPHQRQRLQQSLVEAYEAFSHKLYYYLEPVFVQAEPSSCLATPALVQRLASRAEQKLHAYCRRWAWAVSRQLRLQAKLEAQLEARARRQREWAATHPSKLDRFCDDVSYVFLSLMHPLQTIERELRRAKLRANDPVIAFGEEDWLLRGELSDGQPIHRPGTTFFRLVAHFDEGWSKCCLRLR